MRVDSTGRNDIAVGELVEDLNVQTLALCNHLDETDGLKRELAVGAAGADNAAKLTARVNNPEIASGHGQWIVRSADFASSNRDLGDKH